MAQNEKDKGKIILTADGSSTFVHEVYGDTYHSIHGAISESKHVYIEHGLEYVFKRKQSTITLLEFGFGTGLNAALSFETANSKMREVWYTGIDQYSIEPTQFKNFVAPNHVLAQMLHLQELPWSQSALLPLNNRFIKIRSSFEDFTSDQKFDLIYYDAFAPNTQPELWTTAMLRTVVNLLSENGVLVSYCAKGSFKRALKDLGLKVESLPGAPGKREMTRASKKIAEFHDVILPEN